MASGSKQYGLSVPKKKGVNPIAAITPGQLQPRLACFGDSESDSDGSSKGSASKKSKLGMSLLRESERSLQKKQTQVEMKRALDEDPTVYQYDEIYDSMEQKKAETIAKKKDVAKKPKYIDSLLKSAERRKMENERRVERQVQREREEEGATFADKESFVTSAYRAKLEEFKKQEEQEKKEEMIEAIMDVSKQKDLSGFYRHLYKRTVDAEPGKEGSPEAKPTEEGSPDGSPKIKQEPSEPSDGTSKEKSAKSRSYRERHHSSSSGSSSGKDSDSSSGSSSGSESESESEDSTKDQKSIKDKDEKKEKGVSPVKTAEKKPEKEPTPPPLEPPKPKINIWEKRTVGPVFEAALQRYLARKAAREA